MASELILNEGAAPSTPSANKASVFLDTSNRLCFKGEDGNVYVLATLEKQQTFTVAQTLTRLIYPNSGVLTIASGVVTATGSFHVVDTEGAAATDDLDTINGGTLGAILYLRTSASARDVVLKHLTGNINNSTGADVTLATNSQVALYFFSGSTWFGGLM